MLETPKNFDPIVVPKGEVARQFRPLTPREREELGLGERNKKGKKSEETLPLVLRTSWKNPETGQDQSIEIDLEKELEAQKQLYKDNLNIKLDEAKIWEIWNKCYAEIQSEIEKYGYDSILIVPDNLLSEADVNEKVIETMDEGADKGKVAATWQSENFKSGGSFAGVKNSGEQKYRIVLTHSDQNIYNNPAANPYLKATLGKNIPMLVLNISQKEWSDMENEEKEKKTQEAFQKINQGVGADFETEFNGQKIQIKADGLSLKEYQILQRVYFKKNPGKHLDEKGWTWLLKSLSGSRVVSSGWGPADRQLIVIAYDPSLSNGSLGLRLSRSFSN